ncbi:MAG: hypothetical protein HY000_23675, partial [Planctomycetes bacterium]|nr:hypothetical protein [Planctomycetota bacterium]
MLTKKETAHVGQLFARDWLGRGIRLGRLLLTSASKANSRRSTNRVRSKHRKRTQPAVHDLELRQTVSDSFLVALPLAGVGLLGAVSGAERNLGPLNESNLLDISVLGASSRTEIGRSGWHSAGPPPGAEEGQNAVGVGTAVGPGWAATPDDWQSAPNASVEQTASLGGDELLPSLLGGSPLDDALPSLMPRPHGQIRKLQLAPPAGVVG